MQGLYDAKPFTTYWYYSDAEHKNCTYCHTENMHYLMRYRIFLGMRFPIIPTATHYYVVCSNCCHHLRLEGEGAVALLVEKVKNQKPVKYNKYSQLDFEEYIEDEMMVFGTDKELSMNIKLHLGDMKEKSK